MPIEPLVRKVPSIKETNTNMNTKQKLLGIASLALTLFIGVQPAIAADGTVAVTATTAASVSLTFVTDEVGITLGGDGTAAATIGFGTLQAFGGSVPAGVTFIPSNGTSYGVSTPFDVVVAVANQESDDYTLTAGLESADAVNTWELGAVPLTTTPATLTAAGVYGAATPYTFTLTIPVTATAGAIANTMNFSATAN